MSLIPIISRNYEAFRQFCRANNLPYSEFKYTRNSIEDIRGMADVELWVVGMLLDSEVEHYCKTHNISIYYTLGD